MISKLIGFSQKGFFAQCMSNPIGSGFFLCGEHPKKMKLDVRVVGLTDEVWFKGTRDERAVKTLNCLDRVGHVGQKIKDTFDYVPSLDEVQSINLAALEEQPISIGVNGIKISNGRLKVQGRIDMESIPAAAKQSVPPQGGSTSGQAKPAK